MTRTTRTVRRRPLSRNCARRSPALTPCCSRRPSTTRSFPGQLKNALDWVSGPLATNVLRNKPVAVVGASAGAFGAVWAQAELRKVLAATGARVVDGEVALGHADTRFTEDGALKDDEVRSELAEVLDTLAARSAAGGLPRPPSAQRLDPRPHVLVVRRARRASRGPRRRSARSARRRGRRSPRRSPGRRVPRPFGSVT